MKKIEKRKINKNVLSLIILGVMLAVLLAVFFTVKAFERENGTQGGTSITPPTVNEALGEAVYAGAPLAYEHIEEKQMQYILVYNRDKEGRLCTFDFTALADGSFILSYSLDGTTKNMVPYIPEIVGAEGDFDYTSLYAIENNDSYGRIYLLTYLCTALGTTYFQERIELPDDPAESEAMLKRFGLDDASASNVAFSYVGADKTEKSHKVTIGERALSGTGYYFRVDDRDVVYYTTSNYFGYALRGFEEFVNGRLVAEGLDSDYNFEPYLTSDFKQWINTEHRKEGERVTDGATVIASGTQALPLTAGSDYTPEGAFDGYFLNTGTVTFDYNELKVHADFERFYRQLVGREVGDYGTPLYVTVLDELGSSSGHLLAFGDKSELDYSYRIKAIESVITATDEIRDAAALDGAVYDLIKVTYDLYIDGEKQNDFDLHAVMDLTDPLVPAELASRLRTAGVGAVDEVLDITYTPEHSTRVNESLYVSSISAIFSREGELQEKVTADSYVSITYYEVIDGRRTASRNITLDLAAEDNSERWKELRDKLVGLGIGSDLGIKLYSKDYSYELMRGFSEYRIDRIEEFITSELVVAFRYINKVEQDPFFGESVYENTMDEHEGYGQYTIYGIDSTVCQSVVKLLGGVGDDGTTTSSGYAGEAVALGLTHDNMRKYGLYAHTIYFELPRGIYDPSDYEEGNDDMTSEDLSDLSSYAWHDTLGFYLYISEEKDGYRYVGSDMYDLIARVPAEDFSFLDYSFSELWARNSFLFMDVTKIKEIAFDFSMTDYYGSYSFDVSKETWYVGQSPTGGGMASLKPFDGSTPSTRLYVNITSSGNTRPTEYERIRDEKGLDSLSVSAIYNTLYNGGKDWFAGSIDTYGIINYKGLYEKIFRTYYQDRILTDEEASEALSRERLMQMKVKVWDNDGNVRAGYYAYDFHYVDGSRVLVSAYRMDDSGRVITAKVSDFTISNLAFENIVLSVYGILDGKFLDENEGYIDKK